MPTASSMYGSHPETYACYGLTLHSDRPLAGLRGGRAGGGKDLRLWFDSRPAWVDEVRAADPVIHYESEVLVATRQGDAGYHFRYADGTEFVVDREGARLWATWIEPLTFDDACTYLVGPVLGFVMRLHGVPCLHASCAAIDGRAVAFVGPPGAGKSTLLAKLVDRGHAVVSEDVLPLVEREAVIFGVPGYQWIRLWPDSARLIYGDDRFLPQLTPNWDKRYLDLDPLGRLSQEPVPLDTIYLLRPSGDPGPSIGAVAPRAGLMELVANMYSNYLLTPDMRRTEFEMLGRVVRRVRLREVATSSGAAGLDRLARAIEDDRLSSDRE